MLTSNVYKKEQVKVVKGFKVKSAFSDETKKELERLQKFADGEDSGSDCSLDVELQEKLKSIEDKAYENGYKAGEEEGLKEGRAKMETLYSSHAESLKRFVGELNDYKKEYYSEHEDEVITIVSKAASRVLHSELSTNRDVIRDIILAAVGSVVTTEDIVIRVNSDDLEYLKMNQPDFIAHLEKTSRFALDTDDSLNRGDCSVESRHGEVELRIDEGLKVIERTLRETIDNET